MTSNRCSRWRRFKSGNVQRKRRSPSRHLKRPGKERKRGWKTLTPSCNSSAGTAGRKPGRRPEMNGNHGVGATTWTSMSSGRPRIRSRTKIPWCGWTALGNTVEKRSTLVPRSEPDRTRHLHFGGLTRHLAPEHFEHQKRPDRPARLQPPRLVIGQEALHLPRRKEGAAEGIRRQQQVVGEVFQVLPQ